MPLLLLLLLAGVARADTHADNCRKVLGPLPSFRCLDGERIVTTYDGKPVLHSASTCDRPSVAAGPTGCFPGARIGRIKAGNVDWVFFCRRSRFTLEPGGPWGPIALIGSNRVTGETCFFDSNGNDSGDAPAPGTDAHFWTAEKGGSCLSCHTANNPWIRTPYLAGTKAVPTVLPMKLVTPGWGYRVVDVEPGVPPVAVYPKLADGSEDKTCTQCHVITRGFYGDTLVPYATGGKGMKMGEELLSPRGKSFPLSHWMPAGHGTLTLEAWNERYADAVKRMRHCLEEDDPARCLPPRPVLAH